MRVEKDMADKEKKEKSEKKQPAQQPKQAQGAKQAKPAKGAESKAAAAGPKDEHPKAASGKARLRERYTKDVVPALRKEFNYQNPMAVPKIQKVSINIGLGEATGNSKLMDGAVNELSSIAGQKPVITKAKKSIAAFKVRSGMPIGAMVTLRGDRMYEFFDRLVNIVLPRVRDFRGVSTKSFDGRGNYTLGLHDQLIFPEVDYAKVDKLRGMNVTIVTTARTDDQARALLRHLGMPFRA